MIPKDPLTNQTLSVPESERVVSSVPEAYRLTRRSDYAGFKITNYTPTRFSLLLIRPNIHDGDITHTPEIDIFWNFDTKQVDVKYDGPISDAVKTLMDQFAESFGKFLIEKIPTVIEE